MGVIFVCGRYRRKSDKQKIAESFAVKVSLDDLDFAPEDDIAPGSTQPVVFLNEEGARDIAMMYWGFNFPQRFTFNTRSDSVLKSGLWKSSFEERRCMVPADSFFEWHKIHKKNNPKYEITVPGREPFALAGIWSRWKNKAGQTLPTFSILTSEPNEVMAGIHDRQPVIVEPPDYKEWLTPSDRPPVHLLRILPAEEMKARLIDDHNMQLPLNSQ
ncbi:MAG TPA: SOS response-associated peptidase [Edaphobacter sp.]|nr:SOS response-associated peptidase [Edaphobacter sp.]